MSLDSRPPDTASAGQDRAQPEVRTFATAIRTAWFALAAAVVCGGLAAIWPLPMAMAVVGLAIVAVAVAAPRVMVAMTIITILFVRPLEHLTAFEPIGYLDETMVGVCALVLPVRRMVKRERLRRLPGQWWFVAFVAIGVLGGLIHGVPLSIFVLGAAVIAKGLVFAWAVAQVNWAERHLVIGARVATVIIVFALVATVGNLAAPAAWNAVMASDVNAVEARSVLPSLIGPFSHPIDYGQFMALSALAIATWRTAVGRSTGSLVLLVSTAVAALLSARRTAVGSLTAAWLWMKVQVRSAILVVVLAAVPAVLVALGPTIATVVQVTYHDYWTAGTREARTVLTIDSFGVAKEYFPLGAGFGRFGSAVAATNYSPLYIERGYPDIWGLGMTPDTGRFLTDTEWPAIIGETGFLGALAFALGLLAIYRLARRRWLAPASYPLTRWAGLTTMSWLLACLIQSVATVSFTGPPVYGLLFGLVGVLTALPTPEPERAEPAPRPWSRAGRAHRGHAHQQK